MEKKCAQCDVAKSVTEFHIDRRVKNGVIKESYRSYCKSCQKIRSAKYWDKTYPKNLEKRRILRDRGGCPDNHEWCYECKAYLHSSDFPKRSKNQSGRLCKEHTALYARLRMMKKKLRALEYLGGAKCSRCGFTGHWAAFDFHHTNPSKKDFDWGHGMNKMSFEKAKPELEKCVVLCRNCHTIVHTMLDNDGHANAEYVPKA